jgi:hypothetical protein
VLVAVDQAHIPLDLMVEVVVIRGRRDLLVQVVVVAQLPLCDIKVHFLP